MLVVLTLYSYHCLLLLENQHLLLHHVYLHLNCIWLHTCYLIHELLWVTAVVKWLEIRILVSFTDLLDCWSQLIIAVLIEQVLITVNCSLWTLAMSLCDCEILRVFIFHEACRFDLTYTDRSCTLPKRLLDFNVLTIWLVWDVTLDCLLSFGDHRRIALRYLKLHISLINIFCFPLPLRRVAKFLLTGVAVVSFNLLIIWLRFWRQIYRGQVCIFCRARMWWWSIEMLFRWKSFRACILTWTHYMLWKIDQVTLSTIF